jgi:catechol 2,3-dioxygenase-like lactoylglutathione lyase family enzyme
MTTRPAAVIDRVTLVVSDLDRAEEDYVRTFGCRVEQRGDIDPSLIGVLCVPHARGRRSLLWLGRERIELLEFTDSTGRLYPPDSTSTDLWFQHMAIIVNDMTYAHQQVMANRRFQPISRDGPVRLPDSSGGVTAFKFRDHDGHPLELFAFPEGHVPGQWRSVNGTGPFLGVDHTAIAVSDSARSARFFWSVFGFSTGTRTENRGPEQADLDDVEDVHVSVTRVAPDLPAPRLELLHYHVGTRRPIPHDIASNDIVATHCVVRVASLDPTAAALARRGTPLADDDLMILRGGIRAALVSGPDGHRFLVEERAAAMTGAAPGPTQAQDQNCQGTLGIAGRRRAPARLRPVRGKISKRCWPWHHRPRCWGKHHGPFGKKQNSRTDGGVYGLSLVIPAVPSAVLRVEKVVSSAGYLEIVLGCWPRRSGRWCRR